MHEDSCLEFFFRPAGDERYLNVEVNPKGCLHIGLGRGRSDRVFLHRADEAALLAVKTARTADGWDVWYRLPLDYLRVLYPDFAFAGELRANVYKCGDKTVRPHYLAWRAVKTETPDFHRPEFFGRMVFG